MEFVLSYRSKATCQRLWSTFALRFQPGLHVVDRVTLNGFGASFRQSLDFLAVKAIATAQCREQWLELFLRAIPLREGLEDLT